MVVPVKYEYDSNRYFWEIKRFPNGEINIMSLSKPTWSLASREVSAHLRDALIIGLPRPDNGFDHPPYTGLWFMWMKLLSLVSVRSVGCLSKHRNCSVNHRPRKCDQKSARLDNTVKLWWARWCLKSPASRLFTQLFVQAQIKERIRIFPFGWRHHENHIMSAPTKFEPNPISGLSVKERKLLEQAVT